MRSCLGLFRMLMVLSGLIVFGGFRADADPVLSVHLMGVEDDSFVDMGFTILNEAYGNLGIKAIKDVASGERSIAAVNSGEVFGDVMHSSPVELRYTNLVRVPVPLLAIDAVVFTTGRVIEVHGWDSLKPYHICIRRGIKAIEYATAGFHNVELANQYDYIFRMLAAGRCDVAVLPRNAAFEAKRLNVTGLRILEPPLETWELYHHVHSSHASIIPVLSKELQRLKTEGRLQKYVSEFWSGTGVAMPVDCHADASMCQ